MIPFASPVSFRAAFSPQPFTPDYELNEKDVGGRLHRWRTLVLLCIQLKLHKDPNSKTQTFLSRLRALWRNVRDSRQKFEQAPDRGTYKEHQARSLRPMPTNNSVPRISRQEYTTIVQSILELHCQRLHRHGGYLCRLSSFLSAPLNSILRLGRSFTYLVRPTTTNHHLLS